MRAIQIIETKISQLSPGLIGELDHFLDYLINKKSSSKARKIKTRLGRRIKRDKDVSH